MTDTLRNSAEWLLREWDANGRDSEFLPSCIEQLRESVAHAEAATIKVWDDENGVHYAEGHHDPAVFMAAVNAHIDECGVRDDLAKWGITYDVAEVELAWFTGHPNDEERMEAAEEGDDGAFPITRVQPR